MEHQRDNLRAGLFVLAGLALSLVIVFTLTDVTRFLEQRQTVLVDYRLSDGLHGLKIGAAVTLGDQPIGEVVDIQDVLEIRNGGDRVTGKRISLEIPERYTLYRNALIELVVPTLGAGTKLNIRSVGDTEPYDGSTPLPGALAGSALTANLLRDAGIEDEQRQQIRQIIANVRDMSQALKEDLPQIAKSAKRLLADAEPIAADLRQASAKIAGLIDDVKSRSAAWLDRIDSVTAAAAKATGNLDRLIEDKNPAARQALDNIQAATGEMRTLLVSRRPQIEHMLASLLLTSDQLKLAAIEIRRSPWRLLYKPGEKELETDNLYDAARSFALAAGSLDATVASLRAMSEDQAANQEHVRQLYDYLNELFPRFREAEEKFWRYLEKDGPTASQAKTSAAGN
ncbi:MAG: hypothetical protein IT443_14095 [Phycisphaeraceae bacterium]|nr:hypothetical protein [Phycisphaeraceae bacterium]